MMKGTNNYIMIIWFMSLFKSSFYTDGRITRNKNDAKDTNRPVKIIVKIDFDNEHVERTKIHKLTSQFTLVTQRDATIRDLEANKTCLSQAQTESASKIDSLETKLSELAQGLTTQEEAKSDRVDLQTNLKIADDEMEELQAELETRDRELRTATQEMEQTRRIVEESKIDLLTEKRANRTVSLEALLKTANGKVETLFTGLNEMTQHMKKGKSTNDLLVRRNERLKAEQLMLSKKREISDRRGKELEDRLSLNQVTIQNLRTNALLKAALID
ncbi:MAG: hypothetical protein ASARMPRED_003970 [Alectoria sarmentosa]|nr:MAG: hypothetical protein ASARMPRED_003970 [Alectoria sarmentosa]